jgi:tetratricopeptide (TPR) repeat protein
MRLVFRSLIPGLAGSLLFLSACRNNNNNKQVEQQHGKDTSHVAVDTISQKINSYSTRISSNALDADAYWNRGKLEVSQKNLPPALTDFTQAVKIDSTKDTYYASLADVDFIMGHTREAKAAFEKCISLNPYNIEALLKLGEIYFYVKKYKDAMDLSDRALKIDKHSAKAYFMKGLIFLEVHDTAKALSSIQTAVEQNSSYFDAYIQLGLVYSRRGNIHALDYFNAALNIDPHSVEPYYDKGMFYQQTQDYTNALETYQQLLQVDSTYKFALYNIGFIYFNKPDYISAEKYFSKAIKSDSNYTMAYFALGKCYEQMNELQKAEDNFGHALKQNPDSKDFKDAYNEVKAKLK